MANLDSGDISACIEGSRIAVRGLSEEGECQQEGSIVLTASDLKSSINAASGATLGTRFAYRLRNAR
jgi:hypothetical protein